MTQMLSRTLLPMFTQSEKDPFPFLPFPFLNPHIYFLNLSHVVRFRMESTIKFAFLQALQTSAILFQSPKKQPIILLLYNDSAQIITRLMAIVSVINCLIL